MRRVLLATAALLIAAAPVPARAAQHTVNFSDTAFSPSSVAIQPGDDVFWCGKNTTTTHSISADDGSFTRDVPARSGCTWLTFQESGRFPYHCKFVSGMTGTVTVGGGGPQPTTPPATVRTTSTARVTTTAAKGTVTSRRSTGTTTRSAVTVPDATTPTVQVLGAIEESTTTTGAPQMAISEASPDGKGGGSGKALALAGVLAGIAAGAGYVVMRGRRLRLNQWS